jgi:hypothetical protein
LLHDITQDLGFVELRTSLAVLTQYAYDTGSKSTISNVSVALLASPANHIIIRRLEVLRQQRHALSRAVASSLHRSYVHRSCLVHVHRRQLVVLVPPLPSVSDDELVAIDGLAKSVLAGALVRLRLPFSHDPNIMREWTRRSQTQSVLSGYGHKRHLSLPSRQPATTQQSKPDYSSFGLIGHFTWIFGFVKLFESYAAEITLLLREAA